MLVSLKIDKKIPNTREEQYYFGQEIVELFQKSEIYNEYIENTKTQIINAVYDWTTENMLSLLQNLFERDMAPVLIFNVDSNQCIEMIKKLGSYLYKQENTDTDVKKTLKEINKMEKRAKRNRDKESKFKQEAKNFNDAKQREGEKIIIPDMNNMEISTC